MPASTRQQSEVEERVATSAALSAAEEQATQAAAAEQGAQEALRREKLAREEAEKAREAREKRLAELEGGFESAGSEEEAAGRGGGTGAQRRRHPSGTSRLRLSTESLTRRKLVT
jgi:hypothetical protein